MHQSLALKLKRLHACCKRGVRSCIGCLRGSSHSNSIWRSEICRSLKLESCLRKVFFLLKCLKNISIKNWNKGVDTYLCLRDVSSLLLSFCCWNQSTSQFIRQSQIRGLLSIFKLSSSSLFNNRPFGRVDIWLKLRDLKFKNQVTINW